MMTPLEDWKARAKFLTIAGRRIAYWQSKNPSTDKPWLLLIHGYPTSTWDWSGLWDRLETHFNIVGLDMLGFGLSDKPRDITYNLRDQADLQVALLDQLNISQAHLLVHDYGNSVAQELLARHNEQSLGFSISSLCFLNGGLFPEQHRALPVQKFGLSPLGGLLSLIFSRDKLRSSFDKIFGANTKASDNEIDTHWALITENSGNKIVHKLLQYITDRKTHRTRWVGALKDATIPLRLIDGGADPVSGVHLYDFYREQVPDADAVLLPEIGHYPQTEAPGEVLAHFLEFHRIQGTFS